LGCGEAKISSSVPNKVHSFDLVAANESVVACDISSVPLEDNSVDITIFCLSLMGTNVQDFLKEANRILKMG
jgi:ribosomal RNA-processing protein 8